MMPSEMQKRQLLLRPGWQLDIEADERQRQADRAEALELRRVWFSLSAGQRRRLRKAALARMPEGPVRQLAENECVPVSLRPFRQAMRKVLELGPVAADRPAEPRLPDERIFSFLPSEETDGSTEPTRDAIAKPAGRHGSECA